MDPLLVVDLLFRYSVVIASQFYSFPILHIPHGSPVSAVGQKTE
jgi:ABC-type molybdate transport system permease subunit